MFWKHRRHRLSSPESKLEMKVKQGIGIGIDGIKGNVAQVKEASQSNHNIQPQAQDHIHEGGGHYIGLVGGKNMGENGCEEEQHSCKCVSVFRSLKNIFDKSLYLLDVWSCCSVCLLIFSLRYALKEPREEKTTNSNIYHVVPAPINTLFDGVNLGHRKWEC